MRISEADVLTSTLLIEGSVAWIVLDLCQIHDLNPKLVSVSDAGPGNLDAGSHLEIQISWEGESE
ncbi:MAG: hypothetical protein V1738_01320 [Patescibacteria group bacterium]